MNVINSRSPYFIEVSGNQTTSIQLYIWNGNTEPGSPTYTFTKPAPTPSQPNMAYDISPYLNEYIDNINPVYEAAPATESNSSFCQFKVVPYSNGQNRTINFQTRVTADGGTFESINCVGRLLEDFIFGVAVEGWNNYSGGYNQVRTPDVLALNSTALVHTYQEQTDKTYLNLLVNYSGSTLVAEYVHSGTTYTNTILASSVPSGVYNMKIPFKLSNFTTSNILRIKNNGSTLYTFNVQPVCEPKYTPVVCSFVNRYGGWSFLTFYKARVDSLNVESEQHKFLPDSVNYNTKRGEFKSFNINGKKNVVLNTGFVDENYMEMIEDLMVSTKVLLDNIPVLVNSKATELKTGLRDKNINYQVEFQYSFDTINNVV